MSAAGISDSGLSTRARSLPRTFGLVLLLARASHICTSGSVTKKIGRQKDRRLRLTQAPDRGDLCQDCLSMYCQSCDSRLCAGMSIHRAFSRGQTEVLLPWKRAGLGSH